MGGSKKTKKETKTPLYIENEKGEKIEIISIENYDTPEEE